MLYRYLQVKPDRFKDLELDILKTEGYAANINKRQDLEPMGHSGFLVSENFKAIFDLNNVPASFFPVLSDGQRWYVMMWQKVPLLGEYEVDVVHTEYRKTSKENIPSTINTVSPKNITFSLGYFDKLNIQSAFTRVSLGHRLYLRESLWKDIDNQNIAYSSYKIKVSDFVPTDSEMVQAVEKQQHMMLNDMQYQRYKRAYDYLEQILFAEGDKDVIERFNTEIKSKWEDQFIRFTNGTLPPDERVKVW